MTHPNPPPAGVFGCGVGVSIEVRDLGEDHSSIFVEALSFHGRSEVPQLLCILEEQTHKAVRIPAR